MRTTAPRETLSRMAPGRIAAKASPPIRWRVAGVSGQWRLTTSEVASRSSNGSQLGSSWPDRVWWRTVIPKAAARRSTCRPM